MLVSILVLVDLAFELVIAPCEVKGVEVSILVLVDLAFELMYLAFYKFLPSSFNPCFSGSCIRISAA